LVFAVVAVYSLTSCVQGDLYDLYDEGGYSLTMTPRTKAGMDAGADPQWKTNECMAWALTYCKNMPGDDGAHHNAAYYLIKHNKNLTGPEDIKARNEGYGFELYTQECNRGGFTPDDFIYAADQMEIGTFDKQTIPQKNSLGLKRPDQDIENDVQAMLRQYGNNSCLLIRSTDGVLNHLSIFSSFDSINKKIYTFDRTKSDITLDYNKILGCIYHVEN